jgi:ankyrin repeat protein
VKQVLKTLSPTLDDTYTRMLTRIKKMYHEEALTLLRWLAYARSPPTLAELVDAAIIDLDEEGSIDTGERGGLRGALNILFGLVTIEESQSDRAENHSNTGIFTSDVSTAGPEQSGAMFHSKHLTPDTRVRLAHFSVKEYLESKRVLESDARQFYLENATGHRALAQSCLTYLRCYSLSREKTMTHQDLETFPLLNYAAQSWFYHSTLQCSGEISRETSLLHIEQVRHDWLVVHDPDEPWSKPFEGRRRVERRGGPDLAMYYASLLGLSAVVTKLLHNGADVNAEGGYYGSPIQAASARGHEGVVQLLIVNKANVNAEGGGYGSPIQAASAEGHESIVRLLIVNKANVNAEGGYYGSPIQAASTRGHEGVVQLLIVNKANVNAEGGLHGSPIQAASAEGHESIVRLLIVNKANVNPEGGDYGSPIQAASAEGHESIVRLLIVNKANVNAEGGLHGSPLQAASARGHKGIVQMLIDNGANVNAEGGLHGSPLQAASAEGDNNIV